MMEETVDRTGPSQVPWPESHGSRQRGFNEINGRHDWTRTSDLYRVKVRLFNTLNDFRKRREPAKPV